MKVHENAQKQFWAPPTLPMSEYTIIDNKKNLWNPSIVFLVFGTRVSCSSGRPMHFLPALDEEEGLISIFFSIREWLFQEIILIAALK